MTQFFDPLQFVHFSGANLYPMPEMLSFPFFVINPLRGTCHLYVMHVEMLL